MEKPCTYKEYLRDSAIYRDMNEMKRHFTSAQVEIPKRNSQLCQFHFTRRHKCIFGRSCLFAHSIP